MYCQANHVKGTLPTMACKQAYPLSRGIVNIPPSFKHIGQHVFTDGSIKQKRGGIGIYNDNLHMAYGSCVKENKHIDRIEMCAIFVGIATVSDDTDVIVFTDSLNSINRLVLSRCHDKLTGLTKQLARERTGRVFISKVKAHSGVMGNDIADYMARYYALNNDVNLSFPDDFTSIDEWKIHTNYMEKLHVIVSSF